MFKNSYSDNELGKITVDLNSIEKNYQIIKKKGWEEMFNCSSFKSKCIWSWDRRNIKKIKKIRL